MPDIAPTCPKRRRSATKTDVRKHVQQQRPMDIRRRLCYFVQIQATFGNIEMKLKLMHHLSIEIENSLITKSRKQPSYLD